MLDKKRSSMPVCCTFYVYVTICQSWTVLGGFDSFVPSNESLVPWIINSLMEKWVKIFKWLFGKQDVLLFGNTAKQKIIKVWSGMARNIQKKYHISLRMAHMWLEEYEEHMCDGTYALYISFSSIQQKSGRSAN